MEKLQYIVFIERGKTYNKMTKAVVERHVENIRMLDESGKLEICGAIQGYPKIAGMYILNVASKEEAEAICNQEPLVVEGYAKCNLALLRVGNKENNYLL